MASIIAALKKKLTKGELSGTDEALFLDEEKLEEELLRVQQELRSLKSEISLQCRRNYELDKDLSRYDSKIAHLIHHKITLEEFEEYVDESRLGSMPGSLEDAYQQQLFGGLFFLLQACPLYLAKLTREVSMKEIDSMLQPVMFSLYGNQYEDREECLLLSMFEHTMMMEFQAARDMNSLMRANTAITRMMTTYTRRGPGMKYVKMAMGDLIRGLVELDVSMEINPIQIYQVMMDNEEVPDPKDSTLVAQLAQEHPVVRKRVQENLKQLEQWTLKIFLRLKETIDLVPYGIRWLCKAIRVLVKEKFPDASAEYCQSLIGGFFILRLINPAIVTPQVYHLLPNPPSSKIRRNLTLLAKMIQKLGNVGNVRESYMKPLEGFVLKYKDEFKTFLSDLSDVEEFHDVLQREEYIALSRKDLMIEISPKEIQLVQSLLTKYRASLVTSEEDLLLDLLQKLPLLSDQDAASSATISITLINMWTDTHVATGTGMKFVSLEDSVDELSSTRSHCVSLLSKLGTMVPKCLGHATLDGAVAAALQCPMEEVSMHAKLLDGYTRKVRQLGGLADEGRAIIEEVRETLPKPCDLYRKYKAEVDSLVDVKKTLQSHAAYLSEQIEAYQEYLQAVRTKVGEMQLANNGLKKGKGNGGHHQFTHVQLEREGIILETQGIPEQRRSNIYYIFSSNDPGIYNVKMYYKGKSDPIYEKNLQLEDLLEMQNQSDPVIDMEGFVLLSVRRTLLLMNRLFIKREVPHRSSIQRRLSLSLASTSNVKI